MKMLIRPIRTDDDYRKALASVEALWADAQPGTDAGDQLDVLITLIQAYEREHHPIPPPDPIEAIKFRMEQMGIGRTGLEGIIGTRARIAEVLLRRRPLSISMIRKLHEKLDIPAEILIRETSLAGPAKAKPRPASRVTASKQAESAAHRQFQVNPNRERAVASSGTRRTGRSKP